VDCARAFLSFEPFHEFGLHWGSFQKLMR
jgi:hypothetical protein